MPIIPLMPLMPQMEIDRIIDALHAQDFDNPVKTEEWGAELTLVNFLRPSSDNLGLTGSLNLPQGYDAALDFLESLEAFRLGFGRGYPFLKKNVRIAISGKAQDFPIELDGGMVKDLYVECLSQSFL